MATFNSEYKESFHLNAPLSVAKAHWSDLEVIAGNYGPVDRWEKLDDERLHIVLEEQKAQGHRFQGDYIARYHFPSPDTLAWQTVEGNMQSQGSARFSAAPGGGTQVEYLGRIEMELEVGRIAGKLIAPIAQALMKKGLRDYVGRMKASTPSA